MRWLGALLVAVAAACGGRGTGPVGFSAPRAADRGVRATDAGVGAETSPVPADFRTRLVKLGEPFLSKGHGHRYQAMLWVNEIARAAWAALPGEMPDGALLVEEVSTQDVRGDRPAGLLAMEKKGSAWRFVAVGTDGEVAGDPRGAACAACHRDAPHDSVFVEVTREAR